MYIAAFRISHIENRVGPFSYFEKGWKEAERKRKMERE